MEQWKEELINAKEEIIYVKHERADGATTAILRKILNSDKDLNVLYWGGNAVRINHIDRIKEIKELFDCVDVYNTFSSEKKNKLILKNGCKINIYYTWTSDETLSNNLRGINFDMGVADGLHLTIPKIMMQTCKQKIVVLREKELDSNTNSSRLIDSQDKKEEKSFSIIIEDNIKKLVVELSQIPSHQNTTMYRKTLVDMIDRLHDMAKEVK